MKKTLICLLTLVLVFSFSGCASLFTAGGWAFMEAEGKYNEKEFVAAMDAVLRSLAENPEYEDAIALLPRIHTDGTNYYTDIITNSKGSEDVSVLDAAYQAAINLQEMNNSLAKSGRTDVTVNDPSELVNATKNAMLEGNYKLAMTYYSQDTPQAMRKSVYVFEYILKIDGNYMDVSEKLAVAIDKASLTIAFSFDGVEPEDITLFYNDFSNNFGNDRFITIIPYSTYYADKGEMNSDLKSGILDYVITVQPRTKFETSDYDGDTLLPKYNSIVTGHSYYLGYEYTKKATLLIERTEGVGTTVGLDFSSKNGMYIFSVIKNDVKKGVDFGNGSGDLIVANIKKGASNIEDSITKVRSFTDNYPVYQVSEPQSYLSWKNHFSKYYKDFDALSAEFSEKIICTVDAFYVEDDGSYYLREITIPASNETGVVSTAMYQGLKSLADDYFAAVNNPATAYKEMAAGISDYIKSMF